MAKPILKLWYSDFWSNWDKEQNIFTEILRKDFEVTISSDDPDLLIYSWEGEDFKQFNCIRIYYTPENWLMPKYKECDYSLSFEYWDDPRNLRLPNYLLYNITPEQLQKSKIEAEQLLAAKSGFCSMVVSNPNCNERNRFFEKLSKYKKVDSGGKHLNNTGGRVDDKYAFIKKYKFNICFENASHPGYTTEKIVEAMTCQTIPLYWGNPLVKYEFNTKSFFNFFDYASEDDMIEDIIRHDRDEALYFEKFCEPWFEDNIPNQYFDLQRIRKFFVDILSRRPNYTPIAQNKFKTYIYYPLGYPINVMKNQLMKIKKHLLK